MRYLMEVYTDERAQQQRLEEDVRQGLTARQKSLPPKYFYDRAGSILFERITELPEYYPTRTESTLLGEIVPGLFRDFFPDEIVEIGSGSGSSEKTRRILERPEWIRAWFPAAHAEVLTLCRRLNALLEPHPRPS